MVDEQRRTQHAVLRKTSRTGNDEWITEMVIKVALVVCLFAGQHKLVTAQDALTPLPPEVVTPGGSLTFLLQGERNLYGNNVTISNSDLPKGAQRCFVDFERPLPAGVLTRYFLYIHNSAGVDAQSLRIRLQIWRPVDVAVPRYTLAWQQLVVVNQMGAYYVFRMNQTIAVMAGDRIGWTYEGDYGIISFQYVENHRTFNARANFSSQNIPIFPTVGQEVTFDEVFLPALFSVAVELSAFSDQQTSPSARTSSVSTSPSAPAAATETTTPSPETSSKISTSTIYNAASKSPTSDSSASTQSTSSVTSSVHPPLTEPTTPRDNTENSSSGLSGGAITGIVIAGCILSALQLQP